MAFRSVSNSRSRIRIYARANAHSREKKFMQNKSPDLDDMPAELGLLQADVED